VGPGIVVRSYQRAVLIDPVFALWRERERGSQTVGYERGLASLDVHRPDPGEIRMRGAALCGLLGGIRHAETRADSQQD
jgi:hypothetical protein